jgi:hypothetical protein
MRTIIRVPVLDEGEVNASVFADKILYVIDSGSRSRILFGAGIWMETTLKRQAVIDMIRRDDAVHGCA